MMSEYTRLLWQCRRGTREMDLLFERFLHHTYPGLSPEEQGIFEDLLRETDTDILAWIKGTAQPPNAAYQRLLAYFRNPAAAGDRGT